MSYFRFFASKCENAKKRRDDKLDFVVSACFRFFFHFRGNKAKIRQREGEIYLSYIRIPSVVLSLFRVENTKTRNTKRRQSIFTFSHSYIFALLHFRLFALLHFRIFAFLLFRIVTFSHCYILAFSRSGCTCAWRHQFINSPI
jgi:hypothetical protein